MVCLVKKFLLLVLMMVLLVSLVFAASPVTQSSSVVPLHPINADDLRGYCNVTDSNNNLIQYEYIWFNNSVSYVSQSIVDIQNYSFVSSLGVSSSPAGVFWKIDGSKMYHTDWGTKNIYQYLCSDAWNLTSCSSDSTLDMDPYEDNPTAVSWKTDGTKMFMTGFQVEKVQKFDCSVAWNLTSCVHNATEEINVNPKDNTPRGMFFKTDGTKVFVVGSQNSQVYQYDCSNAWNLTSCSFNTNITALDSIPTGIFFDSVGFKMYTIGLAGNIYQYSCTDSYNVSACTYDSILLSVNSKDADPTGLYFKPDDNKFYITGSVGNQVLQYDLIRDIVRFNSSLNNNIVNVSSSLTSLGDNWTFSCRGYDGSSYSSWLNSSLVTVTDSFLNITFFNSDSGVSMSGTNVTIQFIGDSPNTLKSDTGGVLITNLTPDTYTLSFTATGFETGTHITSNLSQNLVLYLQNDSASLVLITVKDKFGNELEGVVVTVQKWSQNAWITDQIVETDFQGRTEAYYVLSTVYYNHVLEIGGTIVFGDINDDDGKKLIFAEDVSNGIEFHIDVLGGSSWLTYFPTLDVSFNLTYNLTNSTHGFFRFFFISDVSREGCLKVYRGGEMSLFCDNCTNTTTGTLVCSVNSSSPVIFTGAGFISGEGVGSIVQKVGAISGAIDWGVTGYVFAFLLVLVSFFVFLSSPTISLLFGTLVFVVLAFFGVIFKDVNYAVLLTLLVITYLIATIKSEGGVVG